MADVLTVVWYVAAGGGLLSVLVAVVRPALRRPALLIGAAAFGIAGVLGILSIGVVFLLGAVVCGAVAAKQSSAPPTGGQVEAASDPPNAR